MLAEGPDQLKSLRSCHAQALADRECKGRVGNLGQQFCQFCRAEWLAPPLSETLGQCKFLVRRQLLSRGDNSEHRSAGAKFSGQLALELLVFFTRQNVVQLGAVGAVEEHPDEHQAADDVAQGDRHEVPENDLTEANTRADGEANSEADTRPNSEADAVPYAEADTIPNSEADTVPNTIPNT